MLSAARLASLRRFLPGRINHHVPLTKKVMAAETIIEERKEKKRRMNNHQAVGGGVYGLAFVGALIYYLQRATSFWDGVYGVLQAMLWPAFLVHKLLDFLQM